MRRVDQDKFDAKRFQILEAAGRCFARDGFQRASISAICGEAGISPGHLYHYFENKEAIVGGMIDGALEVATCRFNCLIGQKDIVGALVADIEKAERQSELSCCPSEKLPLEMMAEARRDSKIAAIVAEHSQNVRGLLASLLREGQERGQVDRSLDADMAAILILSVLDGTQTLTLRDPDLDLSGRIGHLRTLIMKFLAPPPGG